MKAAQAMIDTKQILLKKTAGARFDIKCINSFLAVPKNYHNKQHNTIPYCSSCSLNGD
jgi:hypothetical protein